MKLISCTIISLKSYSTPHSKYRAILSTSFEINFCKRSISHGIRARSLVVSDLHLETKGSRFGSGCWLCAEVSSLQ